ncbi:hypothetical protein Csa_023921, partial [Cucumis sativus]
FTGMHGSFGFYEVVMNLLNMKIIIHIQPCLDITCDETLYKTLLEQSSLSRSSFVCGYKLKPFEPYKS